MASIRPRNAQTHFDIHRDEFDGNESGDDDGRQMEESTQTIEDEDGVNSDGSDESDNIVDHAVAEDIAKFEETFKGITECFRLINRIGEGKSSFSLLL